MKRGVNIVIGVRLEIFLKKPLGGKHLPFSLYIGEGAVSKGS